jgi:hypothetical protein
MEEIHPRPAGRSLERPAFFPDALLYRCRAGDGADCLVTFDRRTVMMSRAIAGIACRIRIPVRQYDAVAVMVRRTDHVIRLMHRDAELSVDVEAFDTFETAEEYRDRLATFLDLPPLTVAKSAAPVEDADPAIPVIPRRNRGLRRHRARFLTRRQVGGHIDIRRVEGREIIART